MFQNGQSPTNKKQAKVEPQFAINESAPPVTEIDSGTIIAPELAGPSVLTNFTHSALGTFQDPISFRWKLIELKYDPATFTTKVEAITEMGDGRLELVERFKIRSVELGLV